MCDETKVIDMAKELESTTETTLLGTPECLREIQVEMLCKHGRTMVMMYKATGEKRYLQQARLDLEQAKSIKTGFVRPMGVLLAG